MAHESFITKKGEQIFPEQIKTLSPYANITEDYKAQLHDGRYVYFSKAVGNRIELFFKNR